MEPQISVIMPVYNAENYIAESIKSVIRQSFENWELIIINDGSTDNSGAICKDFEKKDSRINYYEIPNSGVSIARNYGIKNCLGKYITFIDADDQILDKALETLNWIAMKSDADIVQCGKQLVYDYNEIQGVVRSNEFYELNQENALRNFLIGKSIDLSACTKLFKKTIVENIEFAPHRKMNEDKFFIFQALLNVVTVAVSDEKMYCYLQRKGSATHHEFSDRWFDNDYFAESIYKIVSRDIPQYEKEARFQLIICKYFLIRHMRKMNSIDMYGSEYKSLVFDIKKIKLLDIINYFSYKQVIGVLLIKYSMFIYKLLVNVGIM
ncbi:glycosyltransferase family 2 protein [Butyrivibrio sp. JL13D10]|uniref:glycosyltransferase family 2 protein n=1 Tax=Butyrivibrio sp. JL13D10 TaxID=3236815 RepID=UPI0038B68930